MNKTFLDKAMARLAQKRPVFHSEADFAHSLAWEMKTLDPNLALRLERPFRLGKRRNIDIFLEGKNKRIALELKYFKQKLVGTHKDEDYELPDQVARDLNRYNFMKDIQRVEFLVREGLADVGYCLALTNEPRYWEKYRKDSHKPTKDFNYRFYEGRTLTGKLDWYSPPAPSILKKHPPIELEGNFTMNWTDYSKLQAGFEKQKYTKFRYLLVCVSGGR